MKTFNENEQVKNLGLEKVIENCRGISILDVGCGRTMRLTRYLRGKGFNVEGIDEGVVQDYAGLIRQLIEAEYPNEGCIPRDKENYDLIISHQNPVLNSSLTALAETWCFQMMGGIIEVEKSEIILSEMTRVTKKSGAIIIYPSLDLINKKLPEFLEKRRLTLLQQEITNPPEMCVFYDGVTESLSASGWYRTILYREETSSSIKKNLGI